MIKNRFILFTSMFIAWAIIFAHSIIPHNHHNESIEECKSHANPSEISLSGIVSFFSSHDHHSEDVNHCHFNIHTTLTKYVDAPGFYFLSESVNIPDQEKSQHVYSENNDLLIKHFYFDSFTHRGPPYFS